MENKINKPLTEEDEQKELARIEASIKKAQAQANVIQQGVSELEVQKKGSEIFNADDLNEISELKLEDPLVKEPEVTQVNSRLAYRNEEDARAQAKIQQAEQRIKDFQDSGNLDEQKNWWKKITGAKTLEEKSKEIYEELGIEPAEYYEGRAAQRAEISSLMTSYNDKLAQRDAAIAQITGRTGQTVGLADKQVRRVTNEYNVELTRMSATMNSKMALMEMEANDFNSARSFAQQAISDYTYDLELEVEKFDTFREENREYVEELQGVYLDALDNAQQIQTDRLTETKKEKEAVMELGLKNKSAGITINDSYDEAYQKAMAMPEPVTALTGYLSVAESKSLGVPYGTTKQEAFGITPPATTTGGGDAERMKTIDAMIQEKQGEVIDTPFGPISQYRRLTHSDYQELLRSWIGSGGTKSDFSAIYPEDSLVRGTSGTSGADDGLDEAYNRL